MVSGGGNREVVGQEREVFFFGFGFFEWIEKILFVFFALFAVMVRLLLLCCGRSGAKEGGEDGWESGEEFSGFGFLRMD